MVNLKVEKIADRRYVFWATSNIIKYSVIITNEGDTKATCVQLKDVMSKGANFIPGTFTINGCNLDVVDINSNINIGSIRPGANILVTFDVEVFKYFSEKEIINKAIVSYCNEEKQFVQEESNELIIPVININVCAQKIVDRECACIGEVVSYSILIRNHGNIPIDDVTFYDELPPEVKLLPASVLINLEPQYLADFSNGINLGTMNPNSTIGISFQVVIDSLPQNCFVDNVGKIEYSYSIIDNEIKVESVGEVCSNKVSTKVKNVRLTC